MRSRSLFIPSYLLKSKEEWKEQYSVNLFYKTNCLNPENPVESLLYDLTKRVSALGFPCKDAELRFEKGCHDAHGEYWHIDGPAFRYAITTCYSSKKNWTTRIITHEKALEIFGSFDQIDIPKDVKTEEKVESVSQGAKFGFLYNARKVFHRGPKGTDLEKDPLTSDDYRLFIRLTF